MIMLDDASDDRMASAAVKQLRLHERRVSQ